MANPHKDNLEAATRVAADIVRKYGEEYWPIFDRLERELKEVCSREERLKSFE